MIYEYNAELAAAVCNDGGLGMVEMNWHMEVAENGRKVTLYEMKYEEKLEWKIRIKN